MPKRPFFIFILYLFAAAVSARAQPQDFYYVYNGRRLQVVNEELSVAKFKRWQVWLYQEGVRIPRYTGGLQYSRWGLIEGTSAESVMKQLKASQSFEAAYLKFFGSGTWGRYTFLNAVGPIAVTEQAFEDQPAALEKLYQLRGLNERVHKLIRAATPSLENNESQGPASSVEGYFDQVRDALQRVSKLHSQLSRDRPQLRFIESGIVRARTQVVEAEANVPKITAVLPSVKLPTSKTWMSHAEREGSDGTIQVELTETGPGILVRQTWTGGDGSMTGTVIVTVIPYIDIGKIEFEPPTTTSNDGWTVRIQSGASLFQETVDSPERQTARRTFPAVHDTTEDGSVHFVFANSNEAQDAYAFFLYHKQRGR